MTTRTTWIALGAGAWGTAAAIHYSRAGLALAHYDARAHLVVSRRIFDSLTPGWQQVGAVWLPLPHLINALPVQIDWLYQTGYFAIAVSIASMAIAACAIARLIHGATGSLAGGIAAAALLMLDPDVLYLQSTPMTEPLLFGTTFLAVTLIAEWCAFRLKAETTPSTSAAGWACVAAVLTRYEAWPIVAAAIALAFLVLLRGGMRFAAALRAVRGLALWPLWAIAAFLVNSKVTVGSWFVSSGFFVPDNAALGHPWLAWTELWDGLVALTGPVLPWVAIAGGVLVIVAAFFRPNTIVMVLSLAACAALPWSAYLSGHPTRVRYDVPLVAAAAAIAGAGIAVLPRRARAAAAVAAIAVAVWQAPPFQAVAPVVVESQREADYQQGRQAVSAYLHTHWDGQPIMMSMGSLAHYMHDLAEEGFGTGDFLHEGNGEIWKHALRRPLPYVEWIAIEERAEGGDALDWQARHNANFLKGYERIVAGGNVALYRRIDDNKDTKDAKNRTELPFVSFAVLRVLPF
jgi:hypothetical protein